jgi:hypothetical protein
VTLGTGDPVGVGERCSAVGVALALGCVDVGAPRLFALRTRRGQGQWEVTRSVADPNVSP